MSCKHEYFPFYGTAVCKKCRVVENMDVWPSPVQDDDDCEHAETMVVGWQRICNKCNLVLEEVCWRRKGPGVEHIGGDNRSHYTFLPPRKKKDSVLESYAFSLPSELRQEFLDEFQKDNGKGQTKEKMILANYRVACHHSLGFDLNKEVRKVGGKVRISSKDLE